MRTNSILIALHATKWIALWSMAMTSLTVMTLAQQTNRAAVAAPATQGAKQAAVSPSAASSRHNAGEVSSVVLSGGVKLEMVFLPPGTFQMGNAPFSAFPGGHLYFSDGCVIGNMQAECPHKVTLTRWFQIGKYPVTQRQWQAVMGNNPSHFSSCGLDCPVEQVSWNDAQEFIRKLDAQVPGAGFRLPTDAEWEYAARAGTGGDSYGDLDEIAWYVENGGDTTHPVGKKKPNAFGLYDMIGQVWEWCQDTFKAFLGKESVTDPIVENGGDRAFRGCTAWQKGPPDFGHSGADFVCSVWRRDSNPPDLRSQGTGLRLARQVR